MTERINIIFNIFLSTNLAVILIMVWFRHSIDIDGWEIFILRSLSVTFVATMPFSLGSYIITKTYILLVEDKVFRKHLSRNPILFFVWREVLERYSDGDA
ncbi:hypothetical protein C7U60_06795 [Mesorhizobium plurifarium]|nr:hypothetical protein C7U60_06795 [Mesorhizobium plurifarium]